MRQDKALSLIGLATKAGKTVSGEFMTEREAKARRAYLVIVAGDASENTKKNFRNMCEYQKSRSAFTVIKRAWDMRWENSSAHHWRCWMRGSQKEF